jgi:chromate reductase, NAD(P)H dehydrogenase (quinone)
MPNEPLFLYALCGSQRSVSTSRRLLRALQDGAPDGVAIEICELIGGLPIFNPDEDGERTPAIVAGFVDKVARADGLIVSCPEYVHGLPGGFKNALDWLVSREEVPFKSVMIAHASHRGDLALEQLREVLSTMSLRIISDAFLRVPLAGKTDEEQASLLEEADRTGRLAQALRQFIASIGD